MVVEAHEDFLIEEPHLSPTAHVTGQAVAVLRAMIGRLYGRLEREGSFQLESHWNGPVPFEVAEELHGAGLIEIDERAPIDEAFAFRISEAGIAFLNSAPLTKRRAAG